MNHTCKKCLLLEAGEKASYNTVKEYLANLNGDLKVNDDEYLRRIELCKGCNDLIAGMCLKCGCYVEIRAALKSKSCPSENSKW